MIPSKTIARAVKHMLLILVTGGMLLWCPCGFADLAEDQASEQAYTYMELYATVVEQLRAAYVEGDKTAYEDLVYSSLKGMLERLDPYCQFMDPDEYKLMEEDTSGRFGGIGVVVGMRDGILTVIAPMEDTPGFEAGILPGDRFIEVNGESTEGLNVSDAVTLLRGEPGSEVRVKIMRPRTEEVRELLLVRSIIEVPSVKDAALVADHTGYVRVTEFDEHTAEDLQSAVIALLDQGMTALILDLRNNPGGLLSSAVEISEKFLPRGDIIVSTKGRDGKPSQTYRARGRQHYTNFPMVILVNGGSASASEIVSGALKDNHRAILLGERTYGKGSVQSVQKMEDESALRYTTAYYYTPGNHMIHEKGIEPDIVVPLAPDTLGKLLLLQAKPKLANPDDWADLELDNVEDVQLLRALDLIKGLDTFQTKTTSPCDEILLKAEK
ncbi:MAG: S41 family peptidase [Spartobacteria bacterium]|nr:S41 family peptidase [Spartobacteria bacterium]